MMLTDYIDSVMFIDDHEEEVEDALDFFVSKGIWTYYLHPNKVNDDSNKLQPKLIFLDLQLDEGDTNKLVTAVNKLRSVTEREYIYLLCIWTKHVEEINKFVELMNKKVKNKPLAFFTLPKEELLLLQNNPPAFQEAISRELMKAEIDKLCFEVLRWINDSRKSVSEVSKDIFSISFNGNYMEVENYLYLLSMTTLTPGKLSAAREALNSLLIDHLNNVFVIDEPELSLKSTDKQKNNYLKSRINFSFLFNKKTNSQGIPGNIYCIPRRKADEVALKKRLKINADNASFVYEKRLLIDITPSCTYNKNYDDSERISQVIKGYLFSVSDLIKLEKQLREKKLAENYSVYHYSEIIGKKTVYYLMIFDLFDSITLSDKKISSMTVWKTLRESTYNDLQVKYATFFSRIGNRLISYNK